MAKIKSPKKIESNPIQDRVKNSLTKKLEKNDDKVKFSFCLLDENHDYFGLDGTCESWSRLLFERMKLLSEINKSQLFSGSYKTLRVHKHNPKKANFSPPSGIESEDFVQIRLGKGQGGMHGVFVENVFYIVWFDPQHNMYDSEGYGKIVKIKHPSNCCKYRDEELIILRKENEKLMDILDKETS